MINEVLSELYSIKGKCSDFYMLPVSFRLEVPSSRLEVERSTVYLQLTTGNLQPETGGLLYKQSRHRLGSRLSVPYSHEISTACIFACQVKLNIGKSVSPVSYTHLRAH